ncbi:hypothetical protein [Rhodospirillum rubrum]|uniref:Motility protein n=1 Tax=Rhodospirillum rubrum (strain ATCC 11170 / ATH 1.1.1 / DSM 467 / LMG 4362 / NCIMB 8255 / S1) TaxID=269796 RepID=Q2RXV2_RHORT|nr:hypothetical protein [Rhodospirillum rubrum]ABC21043.1 hypothetical protein Rru_A0238 [Rhodospirillum rubrum ATCC 11170]AEO46710.1 hypothetical protein F11_01200 [Rhodospirillum rubrum F11]MBK1666009.1 hypothetical protein [Rhodospirillum rubrum]MBK1678134.1 hypothetical protein [Rhodospirillum rubrum]MBK5952587.1 hypothetical protein [Rhodospirillum rubrum]
MDGVTAGLTAASGLRQTELQAGLLKRSFEQEGRMVDLLAEGVATTQAAAGAGKGLSVDVTA